MLTLKQCEHRLADEAQVYVALARGTPDRIERMRFRQAAEGYYELSIYASWLRMSDPEGDDCLFRGFLG